MRVALLVILGIGVAIAGILLHVTGMATPYWIESEIGYSRGLFAACSNKGCYVIPYLENQDEAVQAMAFLAAFAAGNGVFLGALYACLVSRGSSPMKTIRLVAGFSCIAASAMVLICVTVFGAKIFHDLKKEVEQEDNTVKLGYSFGFTTSAGGLFLVAGILILIRQGYREESYIA